MEARRRETCLVSNRPFTPFPPACLSDKRITDRCVNIILQQRMCRLDLSMESWYWKDHDYTTPWPRPQSKRLCMNWEQLEYWLSERQVLNHGLLDEPVYGREGSVHIDKFFTSVVFV